MAEKYAEKTAPKQEERLLPAIRREEADLHTSLDILARTAGHRNTHSESTYSDVKAADLGMRVARNAQPYVSEGTTPLRERFARLLDAVERSA